MRILVSGATGTVGSATVAALQGMAGQAEILLGLPGPGRAAAAGARVVELDFTRPESFAPALAGADRVLLVRPPHLADVQRCFAPFVSACVEAGRPHVVFLSLQGAESNPITPHAKIEALIAEAALPHTFLRPSFFMQNLTAAHLADIRDRDEIDIPAGAGKTAFIDARDIGDVAARALLQPDSMDTAPELTGSEALGYSDVAVILTRVMGRPIRYRRSTLTGFVARRVARGDSLDYAAVMGAIYTVARLGRAGRLTDTTARILGRPPRTFDAFARDSAQLWARQ